MQTLKDMMAAAREEIEKITPERANELAEDGAMLLDIRDSAEIGVTGTAKGAVTVPRGMLGFRADPDSPYHLEGFDRERPVVIFCASGGRAFLAGKTLKDMGFQAVYNLGGFKEWKEAGLPLDAPADPGI